MGSVRPGIAVRERRRSPLPGESKANCVASAIGALGRRRGVREDARRALLIAILVRTTPTHWYMHLYTAVLQSRRGDAASGRRRRRARSQAYKFSNAEIGGSL